MALNKDTNNTVADGLTLGPYFFMRYNGAHFDLDNMRLAFSGNRSPFIPKEDGDIDGGNGGRIAIITILSVLTLALVGAGILWFIKRKRLQSNLSRYDEL